VERSSFGINKEKEMSDKDMISVTEAAKILGCTRQNVHYLLGARVLCLVMKVGNQFILSKGEVEELDKTRNKY